MTRVEQENFEALGGECCDTCEMENGNGVCMVDGKKIENTKKEKCEDYEMAFAVFQQIQKQEKHLRVLLTCQNATEMLY